MLLELKQSLNLKLQQQLVMTPQLQQAIRLLQLSRLELVDAINTEIVQNPALEEDQRPEDDTVAEERAISGEEPNLREVVDLDRAKEVTGDQQAAGEIDWQQWLDQYSSTAPTGSQKAPSNEDLPSLEQTLTAKETLQEHLTWQLTLVQMVESDREIAAEIIGALGDDGFLVGERPCEDIAIRLGVSVDHVERVLSRVQDFDPAGIAARDIQECLLIQLRRQGNENKLAELLIRAYLPELEKRNFQAIARKEEVSIEEVAEALKVVQSLDPRPARSFGGQDSIYITPDIYVNKVGDEYVIVQNEDGLPMLRVSKYYRNALANGMNGEAKSYVQEKLRAAQWLIRSIHQRQRTIYRVMESILKFQREFFDRGIDHLKPLILRDVAEDIGMHESTISRVTSNKYVHTPQGIFELKYFFNSSIGRSEGDDVASASVKHRIKQLIDAEDAKRPLSDQAIVEILKKENINIARRTVAKYREALGILASSKRRKIV
ncbi:MAG: RNA polymerase factor sigma-54 [Deltaproteobacteria bacterium]|nr:RNA polymerase factor sigma-54 [Deltaproteobacteria bacterium]